MLSRFFSSYSGKQSKRKRDKEVSLVVQKGNDKDGESLSLKVTKGLLLEHSAIFREMSKGELKKHGGKIVLQDVTFIALRKIVEYMQKSSATFLNHSEVLETLTASDKYKIDGMSKICVDNLITVLDPDNVCEIFEVALALRQHVLQYHCLKLIDREAERVLKSRGFCTLQKPTILNIIKRTSLRVDSESSVFHSVLGWGLNICLRQGGDPNNTERFLPLVRYLFNYVRFAAMTDEELADPEVHKYHHLLTLTSLESHHLHGMERTMSSVSSSEQRSERERSMSTTSSQVSVPEQQARKFVEIYNHRLDIMEWDHHQVKSGESFALGIEVLKGKLFLTGLHLAFKPFAATKKAACLYVSVSATNESTGDQRTARGTFSHSEEEEVALLSFVDPLAAAESDRVNLTLNVKRAENICLFVVKRDVQIAMPESKAVAWKITPCQTTSSFDGMERCILKGFEYFF